jgi:catechol 2,3-dioxygenase-like lactoylglutathione lyase family enzyme
MPNQVIPTLHIGDPNTTLPFYTEKLGFKVDWEHSYDLESAAFFQISRDEMKLYLSQHMNDCATGGLVHIAVSDFESWCAELQRSGVQVRNAPGRGIDRGIEGFRTLALSDPDGNEIRISKRTDD